MATLTTQCVPAFGAAYAQPAKTTFFQTVCPSAFGAIYATSARTGISADPITPDELGYGFTARSRSASALVIVTPALAPPP